MKLGRDQEVAVIGKREGRSGCRMIARGKKHRAFVNVAERTLADAGECDRWKGR